MIMVFTVKTNILKINNVEYKKKIILWKRKFNYTIHQYDNLFQNFR